MTQTTTNINIEALAVRVDILERRIADLTKIIEELETTVVVLYDK